MERVIKHLLLILTVILVIQGCKKDDEPVTTGMLTGVVTDATTATALENVFINVFNSNTNAPVGTTINTAADGSYSVNLDPGSYYIKLSKQNYESVPPAGISPIPFTIELGLSLDVSVQMFPSEVTNGGLIAGKVTDGTNAIGGALIVAQSGANGYSAISGDDGSYIIFNVPAGSYAVNGFLSDYNGTSVDASVTSNSQTSGVDLTFSSGASGAFTGQVRHLSAENIEVDVALIHPATRETIPGLTSETVSLSFTISNIPDGTYIARATFENDQRVMDPDRIAKFGEPEITISGGNTVDLQFDVTGSVILVSPTNEASTTEPLEITSTTPTFEWTAFASTSDYVIEVSDISGNVIWGGFDNSGALPVKNIEIPSEQLMIDYNSDGTATLSALEPGRVYRWRVFASKNDQQSDTGWTLISASEDQRGLIKIAE